MGLLEEIIQGQMKPKNKFDKKINKEQWFLGNTNIDRIVNSIKNSDVIVIGAGAGLSAAAGLSYDGERFYKNFPEYAEKYGMHDMYSAGFYPFKNQEAKWAYWSKHIFLNRYDFSIGKTYKDLLEIVKNKEYFIITTNVDQQFKKAGFDEKRIFATQGDYGMFQCAYACHKKLYPNEEIIKMMVEEQEDCMVPYKLVPRCPVCGGNMAVNIRVDGYFVEDEDWEAAAINYESFLQKHRCEKILFLELGVGMNTPSIIKYPFWQMTNNFWNPLYVCINLNEGYAPEEIREKSIIINGNIAEVVEQIKQKLGVL